MKFFDTSSLLLMQDQAFKEPFMTSSLVFQELENIKVSRNKTEDIRFAARNLVRLFGENDNYKIVVFTTKIEEILKERNLPITNDNLIVATAYLENKNQPIEFITDDLILEMVAKDIFGLTIERAQSNNSSLYKGYIDITLNDDEMAHLYENLDENIYNLLINEYLLIRNSDGDIVDKRKWNGESLVGLRYKPINHDFIGKVKPINSCQELAFDMLQEQNSKIKVLTGRMGSGKTMLMVYNALQLIKAGKYKKILWLRNTVEVKDTKPIGYLPASKGDKLLPYAMDLADHCGGIEGLNKLVSDGIIEIEHLGFIRGRNISDTIIIANECENMTIEHIQLLIGRLCEDSMLWFDGDLGQVDAEVFRTSSGLKSAIENLSGQPLFAYVELQNTERSEMAKLAELLR